MPTSSSASASMYAIQGKAQPPTLERRARTAPPRTSIDPSVYGPGRRSSIRSCRSRRCPSPFASPFASPFPPRLGEFDAFENRADASPMPTPKAVLPKNTTKNAHAACTTPLGVNPPPDSSATSPCTAPPRRRVHDGFSKTTRRDPDRRVFGKMASTVTGSVAPTTVPNIMAFTNENDAETNAPRIHMPSPKASAATTAPTAKYKIH